jgi:hypothetical protein
MVVKRIIRYVNGTTLTYGVWYSRDTNLCLVGESMLTGMGMQTIGKLLLEDVFMLERIWWHE